MERPKIIVLDDDPTGSQTVHSCLLLTDWREQALQEALRDDSPLIFVLTNTRSMDPDEAAAVTREVCRNLRRPLADLETTWLVVSRSDSTLRGHYPVETDVIQEELGPFDAHFITPAFFEGGRITRNATHYVIRDGVEIPAHETEFAEDSVFGYSTAYLPDYVEEKTRGRTPSRSVRLFGPDETDDGMLGRLRQLSGNTCCVVSAATQDELDRIAEVMLQAVSEGKRFLFRSAASLLTSFAALAPQPTPPDEMWRYVPEGRPGLVLVGSHVPLSTRQLEHLLASRDVEGLELDVRKLPDPDGAHTAGLAGRLGDAHRAGRHVALYTSRIERSFPSAEERLRFGRIVSDALMEILQAVPPTLGYVLSKGGITSNDVLSRGLGLKQARVIGQIYPGCSVVLTPPQHPLGSIPVVIFPGNVGDGASLSVVFDRLTNP